MKILRHPIRAIREPFGTAGLIIACVALVAALGGSALAASGALTGKQKKEVEKIAKKYAGAPGVEGKQGPAGSNGKDGTNGTNGTNGTPGTAGTNGKSVRLVNSTPHSCFENEGFTYEVEGSNQKNEVCDGEPGAIHPEETLPEEASETGTWFFEGMNTETTTESIAEPGKFVGTGEFTEFANYSPISFPIPLSEEAAGHITIHYWLEEATTHDPECPGTPLNPKAKPGVLCLYIPTASRSGSFTFGGRPPVQKPDFSGVEGVGTSGALLTLESKRVHAHIGGTWAVTAP